MSHGALTVELMPATLHGDLRFSARGSLRHMSTRMEFSEEAEVSCCRSTECRQNLKRCPFPPQANPNKGIRTFLQHHIEGLQIRSEEVQIICPGHEDNTLSGPGALDQKNAWDGDALSILVCTSSSLARLLTLSLAGRTIEFGGLLCPLTFPHK